MQVTKQPAPKQLINHCVTNRDNATGCHALVDQDLLARWQRLLGLREAVNVVLEQLRTEKTLGTSLEAAVTICASGVTAEQGVQRVGMSLGLDQGVLAYGAELRERAVGRRDHALADGPGIAAQLGPAGSVLICHSNIVHGSSNNITPWPRTIFYLNLAASDNPPTIFKRAEHHCTRDWSPIEPFGEDCLLALVN